MQKKARYHFLFLLIALLWANSLSSQILPPDTAFNKKRFYWTMGVSGGLYAGSMIWLNSQWYADYPRSGFHFFNDNSEWLQMDKIGHLTTSYYLGKVGYDMLRWTGVEDKKAIWWGGSTGLIYLTTVEIFDGFSEEWGFSWTDMAFNSAGAALFIGQQLGWGEQRLFAKYSYHHTEYAQYRPDLFGTTGLERALKDYNGQTYWLSANVYSFLPDNSRFPKWLNLAFGYSAEGMLGASSNPDEIDGVPLPDYDRYRQYYLSVDVDLTRIPTKSPFLKSVFNVLSILKFPAPALEFSEKGTKFYPVYF